MANRITKQKTEKAKRLSREAGEARKYGIRDASTYRKEMLHNNERPKKAEREAQDIADAQSRDKVAASIPGDKAKAKPLEIKPTDYELKSSAGHQDVKPVVEKKAKRAQAERELGTGLSRVSKSGDIRPLVGVERKKAENILSANDKVLVKEANKRAAKRDEAVSKSDLTPEQKAARKKRVKSRFEREKKAKASAKVGKLPAAQAPATPKNPVMSQPGEGSTGILNTGNIARKAGEMPTRKRRKMERKALYNMKRADKTPGYAKAARLAQDTADTINTKNAEESATTDLRARNKAARFDASKDNLKKSMQTRAEKMSEGPEKEAVKATAEKIIREPLVKGKRAGAKKTVTVQDDRDITKKFTGEVPVGRERKTEVTAALANQKIKMDRAGAISVQPDRPVETNIGLKGSHEERLHTIAKDYHVKAGDKTHPLEVRHLRSWLRHRSESRGVKYDERNAVAGLWQAKQKHPDIYKKMHQEAIQHRTKRVGIMNQQREKAAAKAKESRQIASQERGGKRRSPKAIRVISNVKDRFTEVPNGGKEA